METTTSTVLHYLPEAAGLWPWIPVAAIAGLLWVIAYASRTRLPSRRRG
jgi:hypothetical protein